MKEVLFDKPLLPQHLFLLSFLPPFRQTRSWHQAPYQTPFDEQRADRAATAAAATAIL